MGFTWSKIGLKKKKIKIFYSLILPLVITDELKSKLHFLHFNCEYIIKNANISSHKLKNVMLYYRRAIFTNYHVIIIKTHFKYITL